MKKLINISLIFAMILAFASCEKEDIRPNYEKDGFSCFGDYDHDDNTRGQLDGDDDDLIKDPDDDEDYDSDEDLIVDPDDDEDYDEDEGGSIVDPDDDEDYDEDEGK